MITTSLGVLVTAEPALAAIGQMKLLARHSYHVAKLSRLVAVETKHFHMSRDALIRELGTLRPDGGAELKPESDTGAYAEFVRRMTELAAVTVTLEWSPITLTMLGDQPIAAADLLALGDLWQDMAAPSDKGEKEPVEK